MGELFEFLFIAILIFYIVKAVLRILLPRIFQNIINKAQQQGQQQNYNNQYTKPSGNIKVDYMPKPKKGSVKDSEGEFVDYEEIK